MTQRRRCRFRRRRSLFAWAGPTVIEIEARSGPASAKVTRAGREAHERRPEHGAVGVERLQFLKPVRLKRLRLEILEFDPPSQKSGEKGSKDAIHTVSAFAARQRLALAQTKVRDKSTEIVAPCSTCCRSRAPSSSSMRSDASARLRRRSSTRSSSPVRGLTWLAVCSRDREPNVRSLSFFCLDRRHEHFEPSVDNGTVCLASGGSRSLTLPGRRPCTCPRGSACAGRHRRDCRFRRLRESASR